MIPGGFSFPDEADVEGLSQLERETMIRGAQWMRRQLFERYSPAPAEFKQAMRTLAETSHFDFSAKPRPESEPVLPSRRLLSKTPRIEHLPKRGRSSGAGFIDYSGRRFGTWTIIRPLWRPNEDPEKSDSARHNRNKWVVHCDCGYTVEREIYTIISGQHSCCFKCSHKRQNEQNTRLFSVRRSYSHSRRTPDSD